MNRFREVARSFALHQGQNQMDANMIRFYADRMAKCMALGAICESQNGAIRSAAAEFA